MGWDWIGWDGIGWDPGRDSEELNYLKQKRDSNGVLKRNARDDTAAVDEELAVEEGVLMTRVNASKKFRCMALNPSNPMTNDVMGCKSGGVPLMVGAGVLPVVSK
jgi:hypothetical protein